MSRTKTSSDLIQTMVAESLRVKAAFFKTHSDTLEQVAEVIAQGFRTGHKLLLFGNGGSAADAQHIATEFVGRFLPERDALPAVSLSTDTSMLTALGNDYGFEAIFARQITALGRPGDIA